eukprot:TRINITY_DN561_c1_g1_i1.p1 TRINITY_DN561_c1_g1~~TRINITY_DN561_c1_g1_i1.p1  ORF type:complete len:360 (+),score=83.47 TRINITY_DN561_c1_g1_i1:129-1208(+)
MSQRHRPECARSGPDSPRIQSTTSAEVPRELMNVFHRYDDDMSGTLEFDELRELLDSLGFESDRIPIVLANMDKNKDGRVDWQEFLAWVYDQPQQRYQELLHDQPQEKNQELLMQNIMDDVKEQGVFFFMARTHVAGDLPQAPGRHHLNREANDRLVALKPQDAASAALEAQTHALQSELNDVVSKNLALEKHLVALRKERDDITGDAPVLVLVHPAMPSPPEPAGEGGLESWVKEIEQELQSARAETKDLEQQVVVVTEEIQAAKATEEKNEAKAKELHDEWRKVRAKLIDQEAALPAELLVPPVLQTTISIEYGSRAERNLEILRQLEELLERDRRRMSELTQAVAKLRGGQDSQSC